MASGSEKTINIGTDEPARLPALIAALRAQGGRVAVRQGGEVVAAVVPPGLLDQFGRLARAGDAALDRIGTAFADADPDELDRESRRAVAEVRDEIRPGRSSG